MSIEEPLPYPTRNPDSKKRKSASESGVHLAEAESDEEVQEQEEVEVVSHAEQRKRRRVEKQKKLGQKEGESGNGVSLQAKVKTEETTKKSDASKKDEKLTRSGHGVWVGNLAFNTDADKVKHYFGACGPITRIHMPKGSAKGPHNKGFAYVDFESAEAVADAVALSEGHLDGRRLLIKDAKDYKGRPANPVTAAAESLLASTSSDYSGLGGKDVGSGEVISSLSKTARKLLERQMNPPAPTLFVGNLGFETTKEMIQEAFEAHWASNRAWQKKKKGAAVAKSKNERKAQEGKAVESPEEGEEEALSAESGSEEKENVEEVAFREPMSGITKSNTRAGIRKVRLGTFEDSGKCKGWAFIDFHLISQATLALIDIRNHTLNGRTLKLEYASAEAVRRGGGARDRNSMSNSSKRLGNDMEHSKPQSRQQRKTNMTADDDDKEEDEPKQAYYRPPLSLDPFEAVKVHKPNQSERAQLRAEKGKKVKRQKPGAALADAQREKVSIQPGKGTRTVFE